MILLQTKLAKAIALAAAGTALSVAGITNASAASTTMYNLFHANSNGAGVACSPCAIGSTDGWVYGGTGNAPSSGVSPGFVGIGGSSTASTSTPFAYNGGSILNWGLHMTSNGTAEISNADAIARYGVSADIDTAKGAWSDAVSGSTNNAGQIASGWRHDLDIGLFKSDVGGLITLSATAINGSTATSTPNFGFTIFKGMDTSTAAYAHHGAWNSNNNAAGVTASSLLGTSATFTTADIVAYSVGGANPSNLNTISFNAEAGQIYTILLGGYRNGDWGVTADGYKLSVAAVPVPGAVWLFGSAFAGFMGLVRRHKRIA